jgi:hypothetical protein
LPLPLAPPMTVIQEALLVAVHVQPLATVTGTVPLKVPATAVPDIGEIVATQGVPACVTVNVLPPIVRIPLRGVLPEFAATLYVTVPLPVPAAPALIVIQETLLVAVHAQPVPAETAADPVKPVAATFDDAGETVGEQVTLNANVFERSLAALPPGPMAVTWAS